MGSGAKKYAAWRRTHAAAASTPAAAGLSLTKYTNLELFFYADEGVYTDTGLSTPATNGQSVLGIKDLSGKANNATTANPYTLQTNVINSKAVFRDTVGNNRYGLASSVLADDFTLLFMAKITSFPGTMVGDDLGSGFRGTLRFSTATSIIMTVTTNLTGTITVSSLPTTGFYLHCIDRTGSNLRYFRNNVADGTATRSTSMNIHEIFYNTDSGGSGWIGDIGALVFYKRQLSTAERLQNSTEIANYYGLTLG